MNNVKSHLIDRKCKQLREFGVSPFSGAIFPLDVERFENIDDINRHLEHIAADLRRDLPDLSEELRQALNTKMEDFRDIAGREFAEMEAGIDKLLDCIRTRKSLMHNFKFLGVGSFKECYELTPHFILKICRPGNPTLRESMVYDSAIDAGVGNVFSPTIYTPLFGCWIPLPYLSYNTSYNGKGGRVFLASDLIIQYRAVPAAEYDDELFDYCCDGGYFDADHAITELREFYERPAITIETISDLGIDSPTFIEALCQRFSNKFLENLFDFLSSANIFDLHGDNVGFVETEGGEYVPFIFDWMS